MPCACPVRPHPAVPHASSTIPVSTTDPLHLHRAVRILLVVIAAMAAVFSGVAPAAAVGDGTLGIRPANESDFFHISLYPGAATDAVAVVSNQSASTITLLNYPVDGASTPEGRFTLASREDTRRGVGAWARLASDNITVPANSELKVPFRLTVPVGTPPGDYVGGIVIQSPERAGKPVGVGGQIAVQLNVIQRQGVRIYLRVAGTANPQLQTGPLAWEHDGDSVAFNLTMRNTGNTSLHPAASLEVMSSLGTNAQLQFQAPEILLPGATIVVQARLAPAPVIEAGHADATVRSEAGTSHAYTKLGYAPPLLVAATALLLTALIFAAWRTIRFVRRARHALAEATGARG